MKQMNKYKNWLLGEPEKDTGDEKAKHKIGYMLQKKMCTSVVKECKRIYSEMDRVDGL